MTSLASRCRLLLTAATAVAATSLLAAPAQASVAPAAAGCPEVALVQPFSPWNDTADYFLAPDGGFEQGGAGWALSGRAAVTAGNEPFQVAGAGDRNGLRMAAGGSATTAPFCIGVEHRTMRFFANATASSTMNVDVLYATQAGAPRSLRIAELAGAGRWAPTDIVPMVVNALAATRSNAMNVRLRFSPEGPGAWSIDDVFVDPFRGRV